MLELDYIQVLLFTSPCYCCRIVKVWMDQYIHFSHCSFLIQLRISGVCIVLAQKHQFLLLPTWIEKLFNRQRSQKKPGKPMWKRSQPIVYFHFLGIQFACFLSETIDDPQLIIHSCTIFFLGVLCFLSSFVTHYQCIILCSGILQQDLVQLHPLI